MVFILLDKNLNQLMVLDSYESMIWTDRFRECGDFELYTHIDMRLLAALNTDETQYIWSQISNHLMVIDQHDITTEFEEGSKIILTGESAESLLKRRIIWGHIHIDGSLQEGIKKIIVDNIINPVNPERKIPNFEFKMSTDPKITKLKIRADYSGDNVYEVVSNMCIENDIGFRVTLSNDDKLVFELYSGIDRSYDQSENPYVIFSPDYQNLGSSNYTKSFKNYKNVVGIPASQAEFPEDYTEYNPSVDSEGAHIFVGVDRREVFGDDTMPSEDGDPSAGDRFEKIGEKALKENKKEELFEGQIETTHLYEYGRDFTMGDIVQIRNEYGIESKSRVTELVMNQDQDTFETYPTFERVEE